MVSRLAAFTPLPHGPSLTSALVPSVSDASAVGPFDVWLRSLPFRPLLLPFWYRCSHMAPCGPDKSFAFSFPPLSSTGLISTNTNDDGRLSAYANVALHLSVINRNSFSPDPGPFPLVNPSKDHPIGHAIHPRCSSLFPRQVSMQYATRDASLHHRRLPIMSITIVSLPGLERGSHGAQRIESPWLILLEPVMTGSGRPERFRKSINRGHVDGLV